MSYHEKGYHRVNRIVATLLDGRTIAKGVTTYKCLFSPIYVEITIPNLNFIEEILNIQVLTDPPQGYTDLGNKNIAGNVVGVTISGVADGVTVTAEAIAVGV